MPTSSATPVAFSQTTVRTAFKLGFWAGLGFLAAWAACWIVVMLLMLVFGISLWGIGRHASPAAPTPAQTAAAPSPSPQPPSPKKQYKFDLGLD